MVRERLIFVFVFLVLSISLVSSWEFNGTIYDVDSNALYNATINVTIRDVNFSVVGYNSTYSNQTGWFNLTLTDNQNWFYEPKVQHFQNNATDGSTPIDFVGQSVPAFPFFELQDGLNTNFYLREGGTINISVVNGTGSSKTFQYVVKDQTLGYPIAEGFNTYVSSATIYVPRDRNYSIMVFPNESMPVSFDWNNFSAASDYTITAGLSDYNATTKVLNKTFNASESLIWVSGYTTDIAGQAINFSGLTDLWDEFTVIPFILEPGNMIFLGKDASMPYNMSAWRMGGYTDLHNSTDGFYNITLPGTAESLTYVLFATTRNGTDYYGGYRNISLSYGGSDTQVNFTLYPLMSTDWASANSNITMNDATDWSELNISTARQGFDLVNSSGALSQVSAHIEVTIDYTNYNATEFTFMLDVEQSGSASFYAPLINSTVKEMNVYSMNYAPKRVGTRTATEILTNNNITLNNFDPDDIDGALAASQIFMELYISNSTCDVPVPPSGCALGGSEDKEDFNPLNSIIGGGKISFRMGYGSIEIHYSNVDMLASGPPDALFDDSATTSTTGDFDSAMRFGSLGPTIYDYVLVSIPYTQGSTSQTGLNEDAQVNISLPYFYDEDSSGSIDWDNPIWDTSSNGTSGTTLAGNYSHFSTYSSDWQTLMGNNTCVTSVSTFNATNPCYIDTANNQIWIRLPHFSGTKPSVTGSVITATPSTPSGGGGGGNLPVAVRKTHKWVKITPGAATIMKDFDPEIGVKQIQIEVNNEAQNVIITVTKHDSKPASVSVEKSGKVYKYIQVETTNLEDKLASGVMTTQVEKTWVSNNTLEKENLALFKFNNASEKWNELATTYTEEDDTYYYYNVTLDSFSYFAIGEKAAEAGAEEEEKGVEETLAEAAEKAGNLIWLWIVIILVIVIFVGWRIKKK
jgi:PGF-pre-PGF domain-containing protein